jgi:hypothetical protein
MRIDPHQGWNPIYLAQPFYNLILASFFEWGVAAHDLDAEALKSGEKSKEQVRRKLKGMAGKARLQITKDYITFPVLSGLASLAVEAAVASCRVQTKRSKSRRFAERALNRARPDAPAPVQEVLRELVDAAPSASRSRRP